MFYSILLFCLCIFSLFLLKRVPFLKTMKLPFFTLPVSVLKAILFLNFLFLFFTNLYVSKQHPNSRIPSSFKKKTLCVYLLSLGVSFFGTKRILLFGFALFSCFLFFLSLSLYEEVTQIDSKSTFFLTPPILWNLYLMALSITTYLLNVA